MKVGLQIGYWKPSFNEINTGLKELYQAATSQGILVSGDTEIGGMVDFGINLSYKINKWFFFRSESSIWIKKNTIRLQSQQKSIDLIEKFTLIPILFSGLVTTDSYSDYFYFYAGGGGGIAIVKNKLPSSLSGNVSIPGEHTESSSAHILLQILCGVEYSLSERISFVGEYQFLFGEFSTEPGVLSSNGIMDVSLTGYRFIGGIKFKLRGNQ
jgi:hypothetical protein